jgi:hypothetical protein
VADVPSGPSLDSTPPLYEKVQELLVSQSSCCEVLKLYQILKEEGYMKPVVCSYYIDLSIFYLKMSIYSLVYILKKFEHLFNVCCTSGLLNSKPLRGSIVPWISTLRLHYKKYIYHFTNTEICPATVRSVKHKKTKSLTHEVQKHLFKFNNEEYRLLRCGTM